jgi:hypothetical protein
MRFHAEAVRQLNFDLNYELGSGQTGPDGRFRLDKLIPDEAFTMSFSKGESKFESRPPIEQKQVASGATLDLGDVRVVPKPP